MFESEIRPVLKQYCLECHSTQKQKGDLDLEPFTSLEAVRRHPKIWQSVAEQLADNEMPPKKEPQLSPAEKERLTQWVARLLDSLARERAGDPGPVVLRRLSNAEYTYTIRDLTGITSLDPAREFPVDGAAGEGFMNTGQALVMSPALITKYLDAGKEVASHAVLLPDGLRFAAGTTRRDWADEILGQIRESYREFTIPLSGEKLNLQGLVFDNSDGGALPLEKYLAATLTEREAMRSGAKSTDTVAREQGLNGKYLATLMTMLSSDQPSLLLDDLRARWRTAQPGEAAALAEEIAQWQRALWKFNHVGHLGKAGGPYAWMEPITPLVPQQELRLKIPKAPAGQDVTLYLVASTAGDGAEDDAVIWKQPRLVAPGRPDLLLRDVGEISRKIAQRRERVFATSAKYLVAAAEASVAADRLDIANLAARHGLEADLLTSWLSYLGIGSREPVTLDGYFTGKITKASGHDFINGWGTSETPNFMANSSDQQVRIPGLMKPHSIAVHPSPKLRAAVGWRSPILAKMRVEATVTHAHPECGNGVTWALEVRRGATRQRLAAGTAQGSQEVKIGPIENLPVQPGDVVSLLIGARDGNHSCDLTAVDLVLTSSGTGAAVWNLAADVSPDVLAANPHADRLGHDAVWHFYTEPESGSSGVSPGIPAGSLLAQWQSAATAEEQAALASAVQKLLMAGGPEAKDSPDAKLYQQIATFGGPFLASEQIAAERNDASTAGQAPAWGLDPTLFGRKAGGEAIDPASIAVRAPSVLEIRIPADLAAGGELVVTGALDQVSGAEGSVQFQLLSTRPDAQSLRPDGRLSPATPIVVRDDSAARKRFESAFESYRQFFPAALCYTKIVPVDEVVTLTLLHREDEHFTRLMLDDTQKAKLDRLWDELCYVSQEALTRVDAYVQLMEYATQDGDPRIFEPLRKPIHERAAAFRQELIATEGKHLEGVLAFADRAYRRPLTTEEQHELRGLYQRLRQQELPHEESIRLTLARLLVAPAFLYRAEIPGPGKKQAPVSDGELASRLSYFLWASLPDAQLRSVAAAGKLRDPDTLAAEMRRMLTDPRAQRLATEFACQWLHIRDFDTLDEKSERHFPSFDALRGDMYQEAIRFFADLFQNNGSVLDILDADHAFLNEALAKHYGISGPKGDQWQRVEGMKQFSRGGVLGQAAILAKQSGASRTSPILRGNWVAEVLLGDKLPRPPKDVPLLPEEEGTEHLTVRQLTEMHSSDPRCSGCHVRIDAFGFALESFDAIGRRRERDSGDRLIDTRAKLMDGTELHDIAGLRDYLLTQRRDAFLRQFCRKLLGYALGRGVQLSDEPLLAQMQTELRAKEYRVGAAIDTIIRSRQFLDIRGQDAAHEDSPPLIAQP